ITYAYIAPIIIACGIIGDVLTVITLTHPLLRKSSIVYTYLTLLAMTDLFTHFSVVPMIMWLLDIRACSPAASFFYAHIGFPLSNALMGASVWIVVFLTLSQYMAVCRPFAYGLRSRRVCFILFALAYMLNFLIYAPWAVKKEVHNLKQIAGEKDFPADLCPFLVCDTRRAQWFTIYEAVRELISRVFPFFLVAYMNARILVTYRNTKKDRMQRMSVSQKRFLFEKSEKEEKRLFVLLFAIIIVFFMCTIPAAPLTILVADNRSDNLPFQIFRATVNLLEFTKFALNFYFYCLINPNIRRICVHVITCKKISRPPRIKGHATTPVSFHTRFTKNSLNQGREGSYRSTDGSGYVSHKEYSRKDMPMDSSFEKVTVIKEGDNRVQVESTCEASELHS
ncbi:7 transmembrane receptor, partial [Ostertagia ostertagi]